MSSAVFGNKKGFSLLEVIVSMAVVALVTSLFLANYRGADKRTGLYMSSQEVANNIRSVQNYSLNSLQPANGALGSWGLHFVENSNKYIMFVDSDNNNLYSSNAEDYREIIIKSGVKIDSIMVDGVASTYADIVFKSPYAEILINGDKYKTINLEMLGTGGDLKKIEVNSFGLIDILDI